jgi:hypothetical protein
MAATALGLVRSCEATVMGRLVSAVRAAAPDIGRRLARAARRARSAVLHLGGLGSITAAAWLVAAPLGLLVAGVSLLVLEYLSAEAT